MSRNYVYNNEKKKQQSYIKYNQWKRKLKLIKNTNQIFLKHI